MSVISLRRHWVLHAIFGTLAAFMCAEIILRQIYYMPPAYDSTLGSYVLPGPARYRLEGSGASRWTTGGLRRETPPTRTAPAILALGDSFTQALQVDDADVYTHDLERRLAHHSPAFQVLNAGVSGASIADYVASAARYRDWYSPVWTLVQIRIYDLTNEAWDARPAFSHFAWDERHTLQVIPGTVPSHSSLWHRFLAVRQHSMLLTYGFVRLNEFVAASAKEPPLFRAGSAPQRKEERGKAEGRWPLRDELALLARAYNRRLTVVVIPEFDPLNPTALLPNEEALLNACREERLRCLNFGDHYADFSKAHQSPFGFPNSRFNFGHMNELGHRALAKDLETEITRLRQHGLL